MQIFMDGIGLSILRVMVLTVGIWLMWRIIKSIYVIARAIINRTFTPALLSEGGKALFYYALYFLALTVIVVYWEIPL